VRLTSSNELKANIFTSMAATAKERDDREECCINKHRTLETFQNTIDLVKE
jgi:hypothetical protein